MWVTYREQWPVVNRTCDNIDILSTILLQHRHIPSLPVSGELAVCFNLRSFTVSSAGRVEGAACSQEAGALATK